MDRLVDILARHFDEHELKYDRTDNGKRLHTQFGGPDGTLRCVAHVNEDSRVICFYAYLPIFAPAERRLEVADFVARANYGLMIGNFEMDMDDGEVRYKTSMCFRGAETIPTDLMEPLVRYSLNMSRKYLPGLTQVIFRNTSARDAVGQIEGEHFQITPESQPLVENLRHLLGETADPDLQDAAESPEMAANTHVDIKGGDGSKIEEAAVIVGATNAAEGHAAETRFINSRYGSGWTKVRKKHIVVGKKHFDEMIVRLASGEKVSLFFDISDFFSR